MPKTKSRFDSKPTKEQLAGDLINFNRKWTPNRIAEAFGVTRQALEYHANKREAQDEK